MINLVIRISVALVMTVTSLGPTYAHGGRLDSQGGHNCRTGSCAGTYHCHKPLSTFCKEQLSSNTSKKKSKK